MWEVFFIGVVTGLATGILSPLAVDRLRLRGRRSEEAAALREIIVRHRREIFNAKEQHIPAGAGLQIIRVDERRAGLFATMVHEIRQYLRDRQVHDPSHWKRRHSLVGALHRHTIAGTMSPEQASEQFRDLEAVKWLKLPKAESSD